MKMKMKMMNKRNVVCAARHLQVIDDPGGQKAMLEHAYNKKVWMSPEEIRTIMMLRAKMVHDVEINKMANGHLAFVILPREQQEGQGQAATNVRSICESLHKWGVAHIVKEALNNLKGPVLEPLEVDLDIGDRVDEFEIEKEGGSI